MCGITGFIDYQKSISEDDLVNASAAIRHRGGDGFGHIYETQEKYNVGLANERLATIDPSNNSRQPFTTSCGNYTITFNGTIYNYLELRATLIKYGITFNTLSDTEVLVECYKKWGHQLFEKIDGAFAFAILDRKLQQLFLARDTMGVKPLYFYRDEFFFAFSSELRGMLQFPIEKKTNTIALEKYLRRGYFFGDETIFEKIQKFQKQHYLVIDLNSGNFLEQKFDNSTSSLEIPDNEDGIIAKVQELLTESILGRNVADVNVGVMLSGGYHSAAVAAILQKNQAKKLRTFTLGFEEKRLSEAPYANDIAKHLNTNHSEYYITSADAVASLEHMPQIFDEPMGDIGAIPLAFLISQIAKEDVKVLLGTEGGNELFASYSNYKKAMWLFQRTTKTPTILKNFSLVFSKKKKTSLKEVLFSSNLLHTYESACSFYPHEDIANLVNKEITTFALNSNRNDIKSLINFDLQNYLPNSLLLKSDRTSMYHGIDSRDALLKTDLVELLSKLDEKWFSKEGSLKYFLKAITHKYIPKNLMDKHQRGFRIPFVQWMNTIYKPYIEEYLSPEQLDKHRFFNIVEVFKIKTRFYVNANSYDAKKLWLLIQFQMWYNKYL
ncbi:MAG: asparagine synthase (glutamine-hydrolyzing) [Pedobacter sp.]|uniref:asparagine synthase (glutamine-hydrolyzing) n=1 Tax=Pedobacter sp. TaxID=1411316 RepID=UPI0028085EFE|nr:asparagine synthase (glutamine-hydrolyzing) [Pedobacter sp.]MDQ8003184.1 asparagine synthase (glutamine-hydrolyzing) [Pedobacter sp.]